MTVTNFPDGFVNGVTIRDTPITQLYPGNVFWVNGSSVLGGGQKVGGSNGNTGTYTAPWATIDYAIGRCLASRGDIIMVMPGHTETVSAAGSIACDVAGVAIVGLGSGSLRPTISFTTATAATITVSAANVAVKNVLISAAFADVAAAFTLTTATGFTLEDVEVVDSAADLNIVDIIDISTVDNAADDLCIKGLKWITPDLSTGSVVNVDADVDGLTIHDSYVNLGVNGVVSCYAEVAAGKDLTNIDIQNNYATRLVTASAVGYITFADTTTTNTGLMKGNSWRSLDTAGELYTTAGSNITFIDNRATSVIDKSGYLLPAADS
jgi:hypothetical protein